MQLQLMVYVCAIFSIISMISFLLFKWIGMVKPMFIIFRLSHFCLIFGYICSLLLILTGNPELGKIGIAIFASIMFCSLVRIFLKNWVIKQKNLQLNNLAEGKDFSRSQSLIENTFLNAPRQTTQEVKNNQT